ncbi:DUF1501 domain-containing protein [Micromonospora sp. NBC_01796]|uniref:DUF1501 domain-containing protein n=1 Tax=Micromonospora sp. NBC_01796 TaxID=2975987 RepID=UPI002DD7FB2B|nr:DUF1501 domain-containing protein [Micromonospora sp. NBC_01796]WSA85058.1 DUF1501 domain-containing protein [Micromonospora sp. NBC_01796]
MDPVTRRKFLLASGVVGAGAIAAGATGLGLAELLATAPDAAPQDDAAGTLVMVTLYGGNDGLNTVVPYADPAYHSLRPELAYPADKVLHLDDALGLNPMLAGLRGLWDERRLAVVLGVGYPNPDRSHFQSMDIWQTAAPAGPVETGWIGRWLDSVNAAPETAVSFESVLPPLLVGKTRAGSCVSTGGLRLPAGITPEMVAALGRGAPGESVAQARVAGAYADLLKIDQLTREAERAANTAGADPGPGVTATGTGGDNSLDAQLSLVATCVEARVPTRVYSVSLGGFDTHAEERAGHERLLRQLDAALTTFVTRMSRTEAGQRVTVVVYSEFGRRVRANASDGTDHGTAGPVFVLGPRVAGGFYGEQPPLTDLDDGDLKATVDFRDVFGTVIASVLRADPGRYLDHYEARPLPLLPAE